MQGNLTERKKKNWVLCSIVVHFIALQSVELYVYLLYLVLYQCVRVGGGVGDDLYTLLHRKLLSSMFIVCIHVLSRTVQVHNTEHTSELLSLLSQFVKF